MLPVNLPTIRHARADYLEAAEHAGFRLRKAVDLLLAAVPAGYVPDVSLEQGGSVTFCLLLLAQRG